MHVWVSGNPEVHKTPVMPFGKIAVEFGMWSGIDNTPHGDNNLLKKLVPDRQYEC